MRILLDEHYPHTIAAELRRRDHDAIAVRDRSGLEGASDEELLAVADREQRTILTANVRDFALLAADRAREGGDHHGLLFTSDRAMPRTRRDIGRFVTALDALMSAHPRDDALRNVILWISET